MTFQNENGARVCVCVDVTFMHTQQRIVLMDTEVAIPRDHTKSTHTNLVLLARSPASSMTEYIPGAGCTLGSVVARHHLHNYT